MGIFYEYLKSLMYFLVLSAMVVQILPGEQYHKYIRFYLGLILIVMILNPIKNMKIITIPDFEYERKNIEKEINRLEEEVEDKFKYE